MRKGPKTMGETIDNIQQNHTHNIKNWDELTNKIKHVLICKLPKAKDKKTIKQNRTKNLESTKKNHSTEQPAPGGINLGGRLPSQSFVRRRPYW